MRKPGTEVPGKSGNGARVPKGRHGFLSQSHRTRYRGLAPHIAVHFPFPLIFPRKTMIDALERTNVVCESDSITVPAGGPSGSA